MCESEKDHVILEEALFATLVDLDLPFLVLPIQFLSQGAVGATSSLLEFEGRLDLALLLLFVDRVYDVEQVSSVHRVEPVPQEIILSYRAHLTQASREFVLQLKVSLAHSVGFAADFSGFRHYTLSFLSQTFGFFLLLSLLDACFRLLDFSFVFVDEHLDFVVLSLQLSLFSLQDLLLVPFFAEFLLVSLVDRQLLQAVDWLVLADFPIRVHRF